MSPTAKYRINKLIVLWTVLLLFTPCTTKQSLKGYLGLPVATLYSTDQANKLRSCSETRQASEKQTTARASEKRFKDLLPGYPVTFLSPSGEPVIGRLTAFTSRHQAYTIPIYILHERLLI